jgi:hypothetical protein
MARMMQTYRAVGTSAAGATVAGAGRGAAAVTHDESWFVCSWKVFGLVSVLVIASRHFELASGSVMMKGRVEMTTEEARV